MRRGGVWLRLLLIAAAFWAGYMVGAAVRP